MAKGKKGRSAAKKTTGKASRKAGKAAKKSSKKATRKAAPKDRASYRVPKTSPAPRAARRPAVPPALLFDAGLESIVKKSSELSGRVSELARDVSFTVASKTVSGKAIQDQIG